MQSAAIGLFSYSLAGCDALLSPKDAHEKGADFLKLSAAQVVTLDALGEAIVPGARVAGLSHYIDANLARDVGASLLMVRYLDVSMPQSEFYKRGLAALDSHCLDKVGKTFADLVETETTPIIASLLGGSPSGWEKISNAPPAPLFYLAVRGDAIDIVYGTMAGFEALDVPYVGHIDPKAAY